jgi:hypothetical protein
VGGVNSFQDAVSRGLEIEQTECQRLSGDLLGKSASVEEAHSCKWQSRGHFLSKERINSRHFDDQSVVASLASRRGSGYCSVWVEMLRSFGMNRLLILACSERKKRSPQRIAAIERYDGPTFRVLRKFLRENREDAPHILILSAKFGLIGPSERIPDYDCRLTAATAERLQSAVLGKLKRVFRSSPVNAVGLCLGRDYGQVVKGFEIYLPAGACLEHIGGGLGRRLTQLRDWLRNVGGTERDSGKNR